MRPVEPTEALEDVLQRFDAIAQPGRLLLAEALGGVRGGTQRHALT
jgi:hypothetical protein